MRARISGQWDRGATRRARLSVPLDRWPMSHATYPPRRERHADPEPWRAIRESSTGECGREYRSAIARTRAAKPAAEEARPAAVGKLLTERMRRGYVDRGGREGFAVSSSFRKERRAVRQAEGRGVVRGWGVEFRFRVSGEE